MFALVITEKGGEQRRIVFNKPEVTIGRVQGNDIVLPKGNVSKRHARIVLKDGKFIIVDLKSTNGTYVNGRKITSPQVIKSADKVYIGDFILNVAENGAASLDSASPLPSGEFSPMGPASDIQPMGLGNNGASSMTAPTPMIPPPVVPSGALPPIGRSPSAPGMPAVPPLDAPKPPDPVRRTPTVASPNLGGAGGLPPRPPMGGPTPMGGAPMGGPPMGGAPMGGPPMGSAPMGGAAPSNLPAPNVPSSAQPSRPLPTGGGLGGPAGPPRPATAPSPPSPVFAGPPIGGPPTFGSPSPRSPEVDLKQSPVPSSSSVSLPPGPVGGSPGAIPVPARPQFISQIDEAFANLQAQAAEAFFNTIDPQGLPLYYPPRPEDRLPLEQPIHDIAASLGADPSLAEHLISEATGLGPLENLLDDPTVEEIYVNSYNQILYRQSGRVATALRAYSHPEFLYMAAQRLLSARAEESNEPADEVRFSDGTRVHILMPPLAPRGPVLTVRKARSAARSLDDLVHAGVLSTQMAEMLRCAVEAGRSIIVSGPMANGRTQLLNALGDLIPDGTRIAVVENVTNLKLSQKSAVYLEEGQGHRTRFDMRYLLRTAMRMLPERLVVDSLSGAETYEWVSSAAAGTFGSMASCPGVSTQDVLARLQTLCQLGAPDLSPRGLREQIARAAHVVVVVHHLADGSPRVQQISEIQGIDLDAFRTHDVFYFRPEGTAGQFVATGYVPMFYEALRSAGINADTRIFNT